MKKWIGVILSLTFITLQCLLGIQCVKASGADVTITGYTTSPKSGIYKGQTFTVSGLIIKNISGKTLTNVSLSIDSDQSSSFSIKGQGSIIAVGELKENATATIPSFELVYNGGANIRLPITMNYAEGSTSTYIAINAVPEDKDAVPPQPVDTSKYAPKLSIVNSSISIGKSGNSISIPLKIKNLSPYEARNITITPQLGEGAEIPFDIDSLSLAQTLSKISGNGIETINFQFKIARNVQEKTYPIPLSFNFENAYGNSYDYKTTIYVKVTNDDTAPRLSIKGLECSEMVIYPGGFTGVDIDILNEGTLPAKDVRVSILGLKDDGFSVISGTNTKSISQIGGNQKSRANFKLGVSEKLTKGNYGITVKIDYKDQENKACSEEQQFFIPVYSENMNVKTVPKIILEKYSCNPSIVSAGQNFTLNMSFINTSQAKDVKNIKIYLTINETGSEGGNVFTPVNSSNTFFIDRIGPKERAAKTLTFSTVPDAKAKTYTIVANFEYEDAEGNEYKSTELIGIPVQQNTRLETTEISFPEEAYPGQPVPIGFDIYNMGKVTVSNLMIKLEGDFDAPNSNYFIGNFEPGGNEHYEGNITPKGVGVVNGAVVISFDDPTGQHVELRKDFSLNVVEMPVDPGNGENPGVDTQTPKVGVFKKILKSPFTWVGVGAVAITAGLIIRKRIIKRKEGMELDE